MRQARTVIFLALFLAAIASANMVNVTFTALPDAIANGYYTGYLKATVTSGNQTFNNVDLICDDFWHTTYVPSGPFDYNVTTLDDLSGVRFAPELYQTAAVLLYELANSAPASQTAPLYQFALWQLFSPTTPAYSNQADVDNLILGAQNIVGQGGIADAYRQLRIFTPIGAAASNQEFLTLDSGNLFNQSSAPEPVSFLLIGSGLVLIPFLRRRAGGMSRGTGR